MFSEIMFTGIWEFVVTGKWQLMGVSSMWSFLVYGFGAFFSEYIYHYLRSIRLPLLARCLVYVFVTYSWELSCGLVMDCFGARNWDYTAFDYDFMGIITLEYAPIWFCAGLYYEYIMSVMNTLEQTPAWKQKTVNSKIS